MRPLRALPLLLLLAAAAPPLRAQTGGRPGQAPDSAARPPAARPDTADSALTVRVDTRLEAKAERVRNERCQSSLLLSAAFSCRGSFQPIFDFQFNVQTAGAVADRVHVNVDYDSQREFDASNNISIYYAGPAGRPVERLEVGNVFFAPPPSRFITAGIPSGNYGARAAGRLGPVRYQAIAAQQKGNVVAEQRYTIGDRTLQTVDRELADYEVEPRRFFFTVDPALFAGRYPNVDILDARQMRLLAASLPDSLRPTRVFLYRVLLGGQPPNPNGPQFRLIGVPGSRRGQVYELLRDNVDYVADPSQLWVALVQPLRLNERLVAAYTVRVGGRDTTIAATGGTPDLEFVADRDQFANLLWDPQLGPDDPAFRREIRSVYRVGGQDLLRQTLDVRVLAGAGADQERPASGRAATFLQLFGLAQPTNPSAVDVENRVWPRPSDANITVAGGTPGRVLRDYFLVFPSLTPFARAGLATAPSDPANDTLYRTPSEYLNSAQRPQSLYRIRVRYEVQGGDATGLDLGGVQIRQGSERLLVDGIPLRRGVDYTVDYDVGRVTFARPDTLFARPRQVAVRYEENPLFLSVPTTIYGLTTSFAADNGAVHLTAIAQSQRTTLTRPTLGLEPASSLVAGVSGGFSWNAAPLARGLARLLPGRPGTPTARIDLHGEFATSRPQPFSAGVAYLESFDGGGGIGVNLFDAGWYFSSQPAVGRAVRARLGADVLDTARAATMAWQNYGTDRNGRAVTILSEQIDTLTNFFGRDVATPETVLWLTLYPLSTGGLYDEEARTYRWRIAGAPRGRRWRSIRTPLGAVGVPGQAGASVGSGIDLSRVETLEFWTLADTAIARRGQNAVLVLDLGDVSENSVAFGPDTLRVQGDSTYAGKRFQGFDRLDSERDPFSRAFNVDVNDTGLPGDVVDRLVVSGGAGERATATNVPICRRGLTTVRPLGDARADCTVANSRLDEEDLDGDNAMNLTSAEREGERLRRYVVDLSSSSAYNRVGRCGIAVDDINAALTPSPTRCWVHVRLPFRSPDDSLNGGPDVRRVRALRLTVVSGGAAPDEAFTAVPIARLRLTGAPWLSRAPTAVRGIAGEVTSSGSVSASLIGTDDRNAATGLVYQPPPGVDDAPDQRQQEFERTRVQINERSLRLTAVGLPKYDRAEAYYRFPEGQKSFVAHRELRVWARGRNNGWGRDGELQFFVKVGRDANNFYLYRTPINSGTDRSAWLPEVRVRFERFVALRAALENAILRGRSDRTVACTGVDSALIARAGLPTGGAATRFAACADGYMVYTVDPAVTPPNLAAVQELAVGIVRVDDPRGPTPTLPTDTLEAWIDDVRLADAEREAGYAGELGASLLVGDLGSVRVRLGRRDAHFRQLAEQPTFVGANDVDVAATLRLDRLLPRALGLAVPLTVSHTVAGGDPLYVTRSDLRGSAVAGLRTPRASLTTYALSVRRDLRGDSARTPSVLDRLALTGTYVAAGDRGEYQVVGANRFSLGLEYLVESPALDAGAADVPDAPGTRETPRMRLGPLGSVRWTPTRFRVSSAMVRNADRRTAFLRPAAAADDSGGVARGLDRVWRTASSLELRPTEAVVARWELTSIRDLRDYAAIGGAEVAGMAVGFERERSMQAAVSFMPTVARWATPRLDIGTSYTMLRDPNAALRSVLVAPDPLAPDSMPVPRRLGATQTITAGVLVDVARAVASAGADSGSFARRVAAAIRPIDLSATRHLLTAYDAAAFAPGIGYQLGAGGPDALRRTGGNAASAAGMSTQLALAHEIALPWGLQLVDRAQRIETRNWTARGRVDDTAIDGAHVVYPDVTLRWSLRPGMFPGVVTSLTASARVLHSRQETVIPAVFDGGPAESRTARSRSYPLSGHVVWTPWGVTTTAGFTRTRRVDSLPGAVTNGDTDEMTAEVGKSFALPEGWTIKNSVRARLAYQSSRTSSFISNLASATSRSRLTDNGRRLLTANADTDLADNLTFTLQASRLVNFDRNFNRRFVQTAFTAVLNLEFFSGPIR